MKVGVVYSVTNVWPKMRWVCEAFTRLGHDVVHIHNRDELAAADGECELIVFQHKSVIRWPNLKDIAAKKKSVWVQWWFDLIARNPERELHEQEFVHQWGDIMRAMDVVFVKEQGLLDEFQELGINARYLDQGFPSHIPERTWDNVEWDVVLWGQTYRKRAKDVETILSGSGGSLKVAWAIRDTPIRFPKRAIMLPWCETENLVELCSRAKCVLSIDYRSTVEGYRSDRFWLACGMGNCVFHKCHDGTFPGPYIRYNQRPEVLAGKIKNLTIEKAKEWGQKARAWTKSAHTIECRIQQMQGILRSVESAKVLAS